MLEDEYKWLYSYTFPCTRRGDEEAFLELLKKGNFLDILKGDYSRESVRSYFLVDHNLRELTGSPAMPSHRSMGYLHLALPYYIEQTGEGTLVCKLIKPFDQMPLGKNKIFNPFEIESAEKRGVLYQDSEIVVSHAGIIAETCKKEDITGYIHEFEQRIAMAA